MSNDHSKITYTIDHSTASQKVYDVVIVGSGISGSILANEIAKEGFSVLIVEAGPGKDLSLTGYEKLLNTFYTAVTKDNNAPYKSNPNAPMPRSPKVQKARLGHPNTDNYMVQNGPFVTDTSYSRVVGGTTMHWEAKTPRMLPEDFKMRTLFDKGLDWPITYRELQPYYRMAEKEIGVSGNVESQEFKHLDPITKEFSETSLYADNYVYPMHQMPPSYLDKCVAKDINGTTLELDGDKKELKVRSFPQGRNGIPNVEYRKYNNGEVYRPVAAVSSHQAEIGERCQGNNNCTPICPVQAKYDARKTLAKALRTGRVDLLPQTIASKVVVNPENGRVTSIEYKNYKDVNSSEYESGVLKGKIFILAANAIENARLMLASGLKSTSNLMGKNFMDHPYLLCWGLLPENTGTFRGTICTSGISDIRSGHFRRKQAAFAVDIHNDGWGWATGSPYTNLLDIVDNKNKYGTALRKELVSQVSRQLLLAFMVEMLPETSNKISVNPQYRDRLGNMRPVVSFHVPDYSMEGVAYGRELSKQLFQRLGAEDYSIYDPLDYGYVNYNGSGYAIRGGNHIAGTHIMGTSERNSVVNFKQRSWDYDNLFLIGAGSMPTIGTSNTTLTMAAMCFLSAEEVIKDLKKITSKTEIASPIYNSISG